jgi:long-chain-fatty-acid--CoA ligase ACSBG
MFYYFYREYEQNVQTVAKAFIKLGLERFHGVCIIGFNSPEWFYSDLGAIYAG